MGAPPSRSPDRITIRSRRRPERGKRSHLTPQQRLRCAGREATLPTWAVTQRALATSMLRRWAAASARPRSLQMRLSWTAMRCVEGVAAIRLRPRPCAPAHLLQGRRLCFYDSLTHICTADRCTDERRVDSVQLTSDKKASSRPSEQNIRVQNLQVFEG
jgi:hypothetical protein